MRVLPATLGASDEHYRRLGVIPIRILNGNIEMRETSQGTETLGISREVI